MRRRQTQHGRSSSMHAVPQCSEYSHRLNQNFSGDGPSTAPPEAPRFLYGIKVGGTLAGYTHHIPSTQFFIHGKPTATKACCFSPETFEFAEHQTTTPPVGNNTPHYPRIDGRQNQYPSRDERGKGRRGGGEIISSLLAVRTEIAALGVHGSCTLTLANPTPACKAEA